MMQFRRVALVAATVLAAGAISAGSAAADGEPFPGFGTDGAVFVSSISGGRYAYVNGVVDDPDGSLVVAGWYPAAGSMNEQVGFVARFDIRGVLDPTFGAAGVVRFRQAAASQPNTIARGGGSYVVGGLLPDGGLETVSFDGKVVTPIAAVPLPDSTQVDASVVLADGRVVAGIARGSQAGPRTVLVAVLPSGRLDPEFDGSIGLALGDAPVIVEHLVVRPNGSIVAAMTVQRASGYLCALASFDPQGHLDTSFGALGIVELPSGKTCSLVGEPDGSVDLVGHPTASPLDVSASTVTPRGTLQAFDWPLPTDVRDGRGVGADGRRLRRHRARRVPGRHPGRHVRQQWGRRPGRAGRRHQVARQRRPRRVGPHLHRLLPATPRVAVGTGAAAICAPHDEVRGARTDAHPRARESVSVRRRPRSVQVANSRCRSPDAAGCHPLAWTRSSSTSRRRERPRPGT